MKSSSFRLLILGLLTCIIMSGFRPRVASSKPVNHAKANTAAYYYWFLEPQDEYNDFWDIMDEESEMESYTGTWVNTSSAGGTLIEEGYLDISDPHDDGPLVCLFAHF